MKNTISVIMPTFNESVEIRQTIESIKKIADNLEIIVVDGGSSDNTIEIAKACDVIVISSEKGRGSQLHAGAKLAKGQILWFIHADTIPTVETVGQMQNALENSEILGGNFEIIFDGEAKSAKFLTWLYPHLRKIGLIYGDSAIFVRSDIYQEIGGFKPLSLFEDLEFINRLKKRGKIVNLEANVISSSRRFENRSFLVTFAKWSIFQGLYWFGVSPNFLAKKYYPIRKNLIK
jgi:rSAM/selenodomain-associated transferase 2